MYCCSSDDCLSTPFFPQMSQIMLRNWRQSVTFNRSPSTFSPDLYANIFTTGREKSYSTLGLVFSIASVRVVDCLNYTLSPISTLHVYLTHIHTHPHTCTQKHITSSQKIITWEVEKTELFLFFLFMHTNRPDEVNVSLNVSFLFYL